MTNTRFNRRKSAYGRSRASASQDTGFDVENTVSNYKKRLSNIGVDPKDVIDDRNVVEKALNLEKNQGFLGDLFEVFGRPQQAAFGAVNAAIKGKDVGEGAKKGWTGETKTSGGEILRNAGMSGNGKFNLFDTKSYKNASASDFLGYALDLFADPIDLPLLLATGGASEAVKVGAEASAKAAKTASTAAKTAKAADTALDVAKTANTAADAAKTAKAAKSIFYNNGKQFTSVSNVLGRATGKAVKGSFKLGDKVLTKGLKIVDSATMRKVQKAAEKAGMSVDDFMQAYKLSSGGLADDYKNLKQGAKEAFAQAKTKVGKMRLGRQEAEDLNRNVENVLDIMNNNNVEEQYKYILNNLDTSKMSSTELSSLKNHIGNGKPVAQWIKDNASTNLGKTLSDTQRTLSEDLLNAYEYGKDTSVQGEKVFNEMIGNLIKKDGKGGYTFKGTEDSVQQIANILDNISKKTGGKSKYILNKVSEKYGIDLADLRNTRDALVKKGADTKQVDDAIDEILRKESSITVNEIPLIGSVANDSEIKQAFKNSKLNHSWEYTADEINRIRNNLGNAEFKDLLDKSGAMYKNAANTIKDITGVDYSDIVDRSRYARRAQGDAQKLQSNVNRLDELMKMEGLTDEEYKALENAKNATLAKINSGMPSDTTKAFGSRKYSQPALIANRQYEETIKQSEAVITKKIESLTKQLSNNKLEDLTNTKKIITEFKNNPQKYDEYNKIIKRVNKNQESLEKATSKVTKIQENINKVVSDIDENLIKKGYEIQDKSVRNTYLNQITKSQTLSKEYNNVLKALNKKSLSEKQVISFNKRLETITKEIQANSEALNKTKYLIQGDVDRTIIKEIGSNADKLKSYEKNLSKYYESLAKKQEIAARAPLLQQSLEDSSMNLDKSLKQIDYQIANIDPTKDALIGNKIKKLEEAKSILMSKEGQELFDLSFNSGFTDFIKYTNENNKIAHSWVDALTTNAFYDENVIKPVESMINKDTRGFTKVSGTDLANRLNNMRNLLPESIKGDALETITKDFSGKTFYMDNRVAQLFNIATNNTQKQHALLNVMDKINTTFKKFSVLTPGFQVRNMIGNATNMYLSGVPAQDILPYYSKAGQVLNNSEEIYNKIAKGLPLSNSESKNWDLLKEYFRGGFNQAGTKVRDLENVQKNLKIGSKYNLVDKASDLNMKLNNSMDSLNRMALLMYATDNPTYLKKLGASDAVQAVKYALMDPSNMSDFERNVVKKVIPFYTFTKQNLVFQATNLTKNYPKYNRLMKSINKVYDSLPEDSYAQYQKENMQIPIPGSKDSEGNTLFLKANLPLNDLMQFTSDPSGTLVNSLTPIIKTPIEAKTGKSLYTGQDLKYDTFSKFNEALGIDLPTNVESTSKYAEQLLNGLGLQNVSTNVIKKVTAILNKNKGTTSNKQMWAEIFRSVIQNTNEENIKNSRLYDEMNQYQTYVKQLKDQGIEIPTIREMTASNKLKTNRLKKRRAIISR